MALKLLEKLSKPNINSGSSGWGNYVLYGTKDKPRDNSKVELLDGDISLGDYYSKNNKYEDSYYTVVLGFKGKAVAAACEVLSRGLEPCAPLWLDEVNWIEKQGYAWHGAMVVRDE